MVGGGGGGGYTGNILCVHVSVLFAAVSGAGSIRHSVTCCINILIVPQVYIYGTMYLPTRPAQLPFAPSWLPVLSMHPMEEGAGQKLV